MIPSVFLRLRAAPVALIKRSFIFAKRCENSSAIRPSDWEKESGSGILNLFLIDEIPYVLSMMGPSNRVNITTGGKTNPEDETYLVGALRERREELFSTLTKEKLEKFELAPEKLTAVVAARERLENNPIYQKLCHPSAVAKDPWVGTTAPLIYARHEFIAEPLVVLTSRQKIELHKMLQDTTLIGSTLFSQRAELISNIKEQSETIMSDREANKTLDESKNFEISDFSESRLFFLIKLCHLNYDKLSYENLTPKQTAAFMKTMAQQATLPSDQAALTPERIVALTKTVDELTPKQKLAAQDIMPHLTYDEAVKIVKTINHPSPDKMLEIMETVNDKGQIVKVNAASEDRHVSMHHLLDAIKEVGGEMTMYDAATQICKIKIDEISKDVLGTVR